MDFLYREIGVKHLNSIRGQSGAQSNANQRGEKQNASKRPKTGKLILWFISRLLIRKHHTHATSPDWEVWLNSDFPLCVCCLARGAVAWAPYLNANSVLTEQETRG